MCHTGFGKPTHLSFLLFRCLRQPCSASRVRYRYDEQGGWKHDKVTERRASIGGGCISNHQMLVTCRASLDVSVSVHVFRLKCLCSCTCALPQSFRPQHTQRCPCVHFPLPSVIGLLLWFHLELLFTHCFRSAFTSIRGWRVNGDFE